MGKTAKKQVTQDGVIVANGVETAASAEVVAALLAAWEAKLTVERLRDEYEMRVEGLKSLLAAPCSVIVPGVCRAQYAATTRVEVMHPETLEAVLGARYLDLVKVDEKVSPTPALIELSMSADDPLAPAVRAALKIKSGESMTLRAEAAKEAA